MDEKIGVESRDIVREGLKAIAILGIIVGAYGFDIYMIILLVRWLAG